MLNDYIGQRAALSPLIAAITASRTTGRPLPHALFLGPPGSGKTQLARSVAKDMHTPFAWVNAASVADRDELTRAAMEAAGGILFLDEIHALDRKQAEILFTLIDSGEITVQQPVMRTGYTYRIVNTPQEHAALGVVEPWRGLGSYEVMVQVPTSKTQPVRQNIGHVTIIGATTDEGLLPPAFLSRLSRLVVRLQPYSEDELTQIADRYARDELSFRDGLMPTAASLVASRSRGSPRRVKQLTERAADYEVSTGHGSTNIGADAVMAALTGLDVDDNGLEAPHRTILHILDETGGVSRTSLAQRLGIPARNLDLYWGALTQQGLVTIGRRHEITDRGKATIKTNEEARTA